MTIKAILTTLEEILLRFNLLDLVRQTAMLSIITACNMTFIVVRDRIYFCQPKSF